MEDDLDKMHTLSEFNQLSGEPFGASQMWDLEYSKIMTPIPSKDFAQIALVKNDDGTHTVEVEFDQSLIQKFRQAAEKSGFKLRP